MGIVLLLHIHGRAAFRIRGVQKSTFPHTRGGQALHAVHYNIYIYIVKFQGWANVQQGGGGGGECPPAPP